MDKFSVLSRPTGGIYIPLYPIVPETPWLNSKNTRPRGYSCLFYDAMTCNLRKYSDLCSTKTNASLNLFSIKCTQIVSGGWVPPMTSHITLLTSPKTPYSSDGLGSRSEGTPLGSANTPWTKILDKCLIC